ncbi:MAG: formylglycine-generating enzyme family protein [Kiritimatiellae bacterium]|nr:formylglycine-generating enzyme family protein [Kiritimatiellia bacterium]
MDDLDLSRLESMRRVLNGVLARISQCELVRKLGGGRVKAALAAAFLAVLVVGVTLLWQRRAEGPEAGKVFTLDYSSLRMTMKWCPPGTFEMGSPPEEEGRYDDERKHGVTLTKGFWLAETEVTQGQWKRLMDGETVLDLARKALLDDTPYNFSSGKKTIRDLYGWPRDKDPADVCGIVADDAPVYWVSWNDAVSFCRRLTAAEREAGRLPDGYEYRLPTETEWEYACRAGTTSALPNGRDIRILGRFNAPALDGIAWYGGNSSVGFKGGGGWDTSGWKEKQYPGGCACAREVKGKTANNWGLYDMIGNVWEWCVDWYGEYPHGETTDPTGPSFGAGRVLRGGSWSVIARDCRSAVRDKIEPGFRIDYLGFRPALAPSH